MSGCPILNRCSSVSFVAISARMSDPCLSRHSTRQRSTWSVSQSPQIPITRGADLVARLKEGLHQGFHVFRIHVIGVRSPGGVLLSRPESLLHQVHGNVGHVNGAT